MRSPRISRISFISLPVLLLLLAITYARTLAPTLTWAHDGSDGGDLISAAYTLGIAHPPGYPTYVLLGKAFTLLPFGDIAYRLNLMSAVGALVAAGALYLALVDGARVRRGAALLAALCLGWSALLWSQAVIAEVYAPALAFGALAWWLAARGGRGGVLAFALLGVGLGMHFALLLLLPAVTWLTWTQHGRSPRHGAHRRYWAYCAGAFICGAAVFLFIPLRASQWPPIEWGAPITFERLLWLLTGQLYRGYLFGLPLADWPARGAAFVALLTNAITPLGLLLAGIGLTAKAHARWRVPLSATFLLYALFAFGYNTTDSYVYLLPAWFALAFVLGLGADVLLSAVPANGSRAATLLALCAIPAWLGWQGLSAQDLHTDHAAADYGAQVIVAVAPNAILVAGDERHLFALWYFRHVAQTRTDVTVIATGLVGYDWYREQLAHSDPTLQLPATVDTTAGWAATLHSLAASRPVYLVDTDAGLMHLLPVEQQGIVWQVAK